MAHFLTTNWTDKIKTNPVANMILNSHRPKLYRIQLQELTARPAKGKLMTNAFLNEYLSGPVRDETVDEEKFLEVKGTYATVSERQLAHNTVILAERASADEKKDDDDDVVIALGGAGGIAAPLDDNDLKDADEYGELDGEDPLLTYEEMKGGDMWANTYVDDYINIHHPKLRHDYITLITGRPLQIKPPSVFFSDV